MATEVDDAEFSLPGDERERPQRLLEEQVHLLRLKVASSWTFFRQRLLRDMNEQLDLIANKTLEDSMTDLHTALERRKRELLESIDSKKNEYREQISEKCVEVQHDIQQYLDTLHEAEKMLKNPAGADAVAFSSML